MIYTSGTTGRPKGVRRDAATPEQQMANRALFSAIYGVREGMRAYIGGPLYHASYFLRGDGGFGGTPGSTSRPEPMPDRAADGETDIATLPQAALIYRLSGDRNPLHADPAFARRAGLDRPILHGLCTFAVAARGLMELPGTTGKGVTSLGAISARMTAPVIPGDTIRIRVWRDAGGLRFEAAVPARGATVLGGGHAEVLPADAGV